VLVLLAFAGAPAASAATGLEGLVYQVSYTPSGSFSPVCGSLFGADQATISVTSIAPSSAGWTAVRPGVHGSAATLFRPDGSVWGVDLRTNIRATNGMELTIASIAVAPFQCGPLDGTAAAGGGVSYPGYAYVLPHVRVQPITVTLSMTSDRHVATVRVWDGGTGALPPVTPPPAPSRSVIPAGWAPGGTPRSPASQIIADRNHMPAGCGENAALLFRVRGSGESWGTDRLGRWTSAAGATLIRNGWQVRDMQAIYSAPDVPPISVAVFAPSSLRRYRDTASREWVTVRDHLQEAHTRCPKRRILVAGYSQGALILRYVIRKLSNSARARIAAVYLVGDPTADQNVDRGLQHPPSIDGLLTDQGVDTYGGRHLWFGLGFWQAAYPSDISSRVYQICDRDDLICNFNSRHAQGIFRRRNSTLAHTSYPFSAYGVHAANRLIAVGGRFN
jgi:hypothetical protein